MGCVRVLTAVAVPRDSSLARCMPHPTTHQTPPLMCCPCTRTRHLDHAQRTDIAVRWCPECFPRLHDTCVSVDSLWHPTPLQHTAQCHRGGATNSVCASAAAGRIVLVHMGGRHGAGQCCRMQHKTVCFCKIPTQRGAMQQHDHVDVTQSVACHRHW